MVESLNTNVDLVMDATSFAGLTDYGKIMIGDKAFEFYNSNDSRKFIQIPWKEVDCVIVSVVLKVKKMVHIPLHLKTQRRYFVLLEIMLTQIT